VSDDGTGFDARKMQKRAPSAGSFGLTSIEERASLLNGIAAIESLPTSGTRITVRIPYQAPTIAGASSAPVAN
jgi:signal transduction histidine kinase